MSDYKIKVGLELDDDLKELIHKEIIRQLQEYLNHSVVMNANNFTYSDDELAHMLEGLYCCSFRENNNKHWDVQEIINKLQQEIDCLKTEFSGFVREINKKL